MTTIWAGLSVGAIYVLVALGYNIVFIGAGTFNFAHANLLMVGVFIAYWGLAQHGLPVLVVFIVAGLGVLLLASAEERIAFRPVHHLEGHLVTSVGAAVLITGAVQLIWGVQALQVPFILHNKPTSFLGGRVAPVELWLIVIALVAGCSGGGGATASPSSGAPSTSASATGRCTPPPTWPRSPRPRAYSRRTRFGP